MKVKQLLHKLNAARSTLEYVKVMDVKTGDLIYFKGQLLSEEYGDPGDMKVNSFTIEGSRLLIYAQ